MSFALPPKQINSLQYTGESLFTIPAVNFPRAPTTTDVNYPLFTIWRNNNRNAVLPDALGDAWLLTRFDGTVHPTAAIWVKLLAGGSGTVEEFQVDAHTAPGTNPVVPTLGGLVTVTGAQVPAGAVGTNVIRTDSLAANTYTIEIQRTAAVGVSASANNGVSHFNSANFTVDTNGFVSLKGGGEAVDSLTGDVGGAVAPDAAGNIDIHGQNPALINGVETYFIGANELGVRMKSPFRGDFEFDNVAAATPRSVVISNADNTSALSTAEFQTLVDVGSGADSYFNAAIAGTRSYAIGIDTSDTSSFKLTTEATSGANPSSASVIMRSNTAGQVNLPLQPSFNARPSADILNQTGDGTVYTIVFDDAFFNVSASYNTATGIFTAPVTGKYLLCATISLTNIAAGHTDCRMSIPTSGGSGGVEFFDINPAVTATAGGNTLTGSGSGIFLMNAGDTARVNIQVSGATKTITVVETSTFSGQLIS